MCFKFYQRVETVFGNVFEKYGRFIARHPLKVIIIVATINIGLGFGLFRLKTESGIEQYTPKDSTASKNKDQIISMFTVNTSANFYVQSIPDFGYFASIIIEKKDGGNILDNSLWSDLSDIYAFVNSTVAYDDSANSLMHTDVCAKRFSACVVGGDLIFSSSFISDMNAGTISYPYYTHEGQNVTIGRIIGGVEVSNDYITSGKAIKLTFWLQSENSDLSRKWELAFIDKIATYSSSTFSVKYAYSDSLTVELGKSVTGDIKFFSITFTLMITFSALVLMGGNCVANRYNLGFAGILGTGLAIVGAFGLVTLCGATFVDLVGIMPFLVIGIGVDDMFILLSGLADTAHIDIEDVEARIGKTMRSSGVAITITSITDVIAFCAGAASVFPSVSNFSWYTGCAILFCYINYITFFTGCMTINEKRVSKNMHFWTCMKIKSKEELKEDGASDCKLFWCSGAPHKHRDELEGPIEKYPKLLIKKIVLFKPAQVVIIILFATYLGFAIWGTTGFREDLDRRDLLLTSSYYYDFFDTDQTLFSQSLSVSLNIQSGVDYISEFDKVDTLVTNVRNDYQVSDDFLISWIHSYRSSAVYDDSSAANFISGLQTFLATTAGNVFINDVTIDTASNSISASRLHVQTSSITKSGEHADLMVRIRDIVDSSSLPVFAFSPAFIFFEQYVAIVPQTLQTLGICVGVVFLVTAFFMPLPLVILLVTITVVMIMVGVIGFINFWGLTLSSVTMIHIIMCVGFCIDFSTHICHAFVQAEGLRNVRVAHAIDMAGGPIFNGAMSTILGVLMLAFSSSYIFSSFFKVMFLVMVFGFVHALFLLPVILAYIGPQYEDESVYPESVKVPEPKPDYPGADEFYNNPPLSGKKVDVVSPVDQK